MTQLSESLRCNSFPEVALVSLAAFLLILPSFSQAATPVDQVYLDRPTTGPRLINPKYIRSNQSGDLRIWDRGNRQFIAVNLSDTKPFRSTNYTTSKTWDRVVYNRKLEQWEVQHDPQSFWDQEGTFWISDRQRRGDTTTRVVAASSTDPREVSFPFPVESIIPRNSHWIIQAANDREPLYRWDPEGENGPVDTFPLQFSGTLRSMLGDSQFVTTTGDELRIYEGNTLLRARSFKKIKSIDVHEGSIYVLDKNRLLRLNKHFSIEYTFRIPSNRTYRDFSLHGDRVYLVGESGLGSARLSQSSRSFFNQRSSLEIVSHVRTFDTSFTDRPGSGFWIESSDTSNHSVLVKTGKNHVRKVKFNGKKLRKQKQHVPIDSLSRDAFQFFQIEETYWNGHNRLYYYFDKENAVESYDSSGQLVRRTNISRKKGKLLKNLSLLSANSNRIFMEGDQVYPDRGFRRSLLVFDWDGTLKRSVRFHHPEHDHKFPNTPNELPLRMGRNGNIFELSPGKIQMYDTYGYPARTLDDVFFPEDVYTTQQYIYVLDLAGQRLKVFEKNDDPRYRFASPVESFEVTGVTSRSSKKTIVSGYSTRDEQSSRSSLYEYDKRSRELQEVLKHPTRTLSYPVMAPEENSLYFWGRKPGHNSWLLYESDLVRYSARPLNHRLNIRESGFYSSEYKKLFVPVKTSFSRKYRYRQIDPEGDDQPLLKSQNLKELKSGGFSGFYGVEEEADYHRLYSGYLDRQYETSPLRWNRSDTLFQTTSSIEEIVPRNGDIYISIRTDHGNSKLGVINKSSLRWSAKNDTRTSPVQWLFESIGKINFLSENSRYIRIFHEFGDEHGQLVDLMKRSSAKGNVQGDLKMNLPGSLEGLNVQLDPAGYYTETTEGGRFTMNDVPVGYLRLVEGTHQFNFQFPVDFSVQESDYTVRSGIPIEREDNLMLLEKGRKFLQEGNYKRARISLEAFIELIQQGPYHRRTNGLLEHIYRRQGKIRSLSKLHNEYPELFSPEEKMKLFLSTGTKPEAEKLLNEFSSVPSTRDARLLRYLSESYDSSSPVGTDQDPPVYPFYGNPVIKLQSIMN